MSLPFKECKKHGVLEDKDKRRTIEYGTINVRCKICRKQSCKKYRKNNPQIVKKINSNKNKKKVLEVKDHYIVDIIRRYDKTLKSNDIPKGFIEAWKILLLIKRNYRKIHNGK